MSSPLPSECPAERAAAPAQLPLGEILIREVVTAPPDTPIAQVLGRMENRRISCVVVVEGRRPVGIFTERDAVRLMAGGNRLLSAPVSAVMSQPLLTAGPRLDLSNAYQLLSEGKFRHLVVVDEAGELIGIVTQSDFVRQLGGSTEERKPVAAVMSRRVITLAPSECLAAAVHLMFERNLSCVVVTEGDRPIGILTERDVVALSNSHADPAALTIGEVMSHPVRTIGADLTLEEAARLMRRERIRRLVVVNGSGGLAGLLTRHDLVRALEARYLDFLRSTIDRQQLELSQARERLALAERQLFYRHVMDQVNDAVLVVEAKSGRIVEVNDRAAQISGYSREAFTRLRVWEISAAIRSEAEWPAQAERFMRAGNTVLTSEHRRRDGSSYPVEVSVRYVRSEGRDLLVAVARDITERRRSEQALVERELLLTTLIEALPEAIYLKDERGAWQVANSRGLALFGLEQAPWRGKTETELGALSQRPEIHAACLASDEQAWAAGETTRLPEVIPGQDGEPRYFDVLKVPLFHPDGRRKGLVVVGRDITSERVAEGLLRASERSYRGLFNSVTEAIYILDAEGRFLDVNAAAMAMYGHPREFFLGRSPEALAAPGRNDLAATAAQVRSAFAGEPCQFEFWGMRADGELFPMEVNLSAGSYFGRPAVIAVARDVTQRRRSEERLRQAAAVYESTAEGVVITDIHGRIVAVNRAFSDITGYSEAEVLGRTTELLHSGRHGPEFFERMWETIRAQGGWQGEVWNRRKNGEIYPEWLTVTTVRDASGRLLNHVGVFSDISLIKHSEAKLDHLAHHDPLTDLPNRLLVHSRLAHALERAQRYGHHVALLFMDLDRFKTLNDSLGHPAGDELLTAIADRLRRDLREEETLARQGGDEFLLLMESLERPEEAAGRSREILALLATPFALAGGHEVYASASIGISLFPTDGADPTRLIRNADTAMYQAKAAGGGSYRFYTGALTRAAHDRLSLETRLRRALEREEFVLHYQPQVDLACGRIIGAEALLRWNSPDEGQVPPMRFVHLAEETGLIEPLGEWVLHTACAVARGWCERGLPPITMAVNFSGRQFRNPHLVLRVRSILEQTGLSPRQLEVEITESTVMEQGELAETSLNALKELGVSLAVDDFGTGYSSLASLKRLAVHKLKIDRSFVRDIPEELSDMEIAATIIAMGRNLGLTVLAEGVESHAQLNFLRVQGCHAGQGFFWSKAVPAEEFELLLGRSAAPG